MKKREFIEFMVIEANQYRNGLLLRSILDLMKGEMLTAENVSKIIIPLLGKIDNMLEENDKEKLRVSLIEFSPIAIDRMKINPGMHRSDGTRAVNKVNIDALLIMYLHFTFDIPTLHSDYLIN
ncbi:MAG: hypothetical protein UR85_C0008G0010 [Candidatus Nomurabacteria bacterium GW2011_GWF2_35_66]|uniref:Uncharacterized protein n=1 Tax=Candidatus Nomurabacteria bacterium GW2011_GWE1_35_16 TaxID=1618761 RepID=A0A0G0DTD0_9BACT|nr:MAG: hypothetical protein UR55_C0011G0010 [Candidatus Nomurabacteria bacterium GW2011_GWF1_34_20]KKP62846.1 MAG: hypothetical protein UR57_C0010G0010 [Candidatus Nomurabacteria bacterium GW2011_GWE2_34_25]KKP66245.1 MAG: hypothetical protein UR64_C0010G0010 [Candidatus Nomurabacteria bacterium GW2011_GWE1_35_16]KKP83077.1 MAG: hypothetical protein UR85_C0008G0010 [Candidatus Nomurabacteria bacterium GW2011_GWF2_35_66]HAE36672.1 hypothetical protein [Candidatus Nomurabacteria bacterium]